MSEITQDLSPIANATHYKVVLKADTLNNTTVTNEITDVTSYTDTPFMDFSEEWDKAVLASTGGSSTLFRAEKYTNDNLGVTLVKVRIPKSVLSIDFGNGTDNNFVSVLENPIYFYSETDQGDIAYEHSFYYPTVITVKILRGETAQDISPEVEIHNLHSTSHNTRFMSVASEIREDSFVTNDFIEKYKVNESNTTTTYAPNSQFVNSYLVSQDFRIFFMGNLIKDGESVITPTTSEKHARNLIGEGSDTVTVVQNVITGYDQITLNSVYVPDSTSNVYTTIGNGNIHNYYTDTCELGNRS